VTGLPLFPLGTVLFPGLVLPLNVFEDRYRALVRHLMALPGGQPREFGVVAIQRGWETGEHGSMTFYDTGCTAEVRQITEHGDGRFDLVTVGRRRFTITSIEPSAAPYLTAEVRFISEEVGPEGETERLVPQVLELFQRYLRLLRPDQPGEQLPDDPTVLSHLIAATAALPLAERQVLLVARNTAARLRAELALLHRENQLLSRVRAVPVPLAELGVSPSSN
jgi:uncharacterized protein